MNRPYTINVIAGYEKLPFPGLNEWTTAMRSGEYKQASGVLYSPPNATEDGGYCCLGLLSKIQGRLTPTHRRDGNNSTSSTYLCETNPVIRYGIKGTGISIPYGVRVNYESCGSPSEVSNFAVLNDDARMSFEQIADIANICFKHVPAITVPNESSPESPAQ